MEELLVAIIQFIFELVINIGSLGPFDYASDRGSSKTFSLNALPALAWFVFGGLLGAATLLFFRQTLIHHGWERMANVVVSPIVSAYLAQLLSGLRAGGNPEVLPREHFWHAFSFSLAFALVRFAYAVRA